VRGTARRCASKPGNARDRQGLHPAQHGMPVRTIQKYSCGEWVANEPVPLSSGQVLRHACKWVLCTICFIAHCTPGSDWTAVAPSEAGKQLPGCPVRNPRPSAGPSTGEDWPGSARAAAAGRGGPPAARHAPGGEWERAHARLPPRSRCVWGGEPRGSDHQRPSGTPMRATEWYHSQA
jgi:hypothetical protein